MVLDHDDGSSVEHEELDWDTYIAGQIALNVRDGLYIVDEAENIAEHMAANIAGVVPSLSAASTLTPSCGRWPYACGGGKAEAQAGEGGGPGHRAVHARKCQQDEDRFSPTQR